MRRWLSALVCLCAGCFAAAGCADAPKRGKINLPKEDFHTPPANLFSGPVKYPDDVLNNVKPRGPRDDKNGPPGGWDNMPSPGSNMGGMGMGAPGR